MTGPERRGPERPGPERSSPDYPPEWDNEPTWVTCRTCNGDGTIRRGEFDWTCPGCAGDGGGEP